jgi:hypothetical protein
VSVRYPTMADRIMANVRQDPGGCWVWQGETNISGYGRLELSGRPNRKRVLAHRLSYEVFVGPIPAGLHLDHLCRNPPCVNPEHLEPVTCRENLLRSPITVAAVNAQKTHCVRGHEFSDGNTILEPRPNGSVRKCRTCARARWRAWYERRSLRAAAVKAA